MGKILSAVKEGFKKGWLEGKTETDSFLNISTEVGKRLAKPIGSFPFLIYFIVITILMGLAGVFTTIHQEFQKDSDYVSHANITLSIATYFIALLASSSTDLIFLKEEEESAKQLKHLGVAMLLLGVGLFWLSVIFPNYAFDFLFDIPLISDIFDFDISPIFVYYIPPIIGTSLALFAWWIANANNPNFNMEIVPENATPGSDEIGPDDTATDKYNI